MNVVIGHSAGEYINNASSDSNVLIGVQAARGGAGKIDRCVVIGKDAMDNTGSIDAQQNIFIGDNAGGGTWTGSACNSNVAIGATAMSGVKWMEL